MLGKQSQLNKGEMLYDTFRAVKQLGRGGMGRVLQVKADRNAPGFSSFLAAAVAWQEVIQHKEIVPLRLRIARFNKELHALMEQESRLMDRGDYKGSEVIQMEIEALQRVLLIQVEDLKRKQKYYIEQRSSQITEVSTEAMIQHLKKKGLNYPDDDIFAMKQVLLDDPQHISRLHDEFRSLKLVQHDNIMKVYDMGPDYYIMEYISEIIGAEEIIANPKHQEQDYTNKERIAIVIEAAKAIEHAHVFGVIHRDIKPDNIAVDKKGNAKLIDFGLVKSVETEGVTLAGVALGTPYYMSPEQIESTSEPWETFDIYSLGATLYHYLTGERPYARARNKYTGEEKETKSAQDVFLTVCNMSYEPIPPSEVATGIPQVLEDIIMKAMAKEKSLRYQSVKEFREDLEQYLNLADKHSLSSGSYIGIKPELLLQMRVRKRRKRPVDRVKERGKKVSLTQNIVIGVFIIVVILLVGYFAMTDNDNDNKKREARVQSTLAILAERTENIKKIYEFAEQYKMENPADFKNIIYNYNKVIEYGRGTPYELMAQTKANKVKIECTEEKKKVIAQLQEQSVQLVEKNEFNRAIEIYTVYNGILRDDKEVVDIRESRAKEIEWKQSLYLKKKAKEEERIKERHEEEQRKREAEEKERKRIEEEKKRNILKVELPLLLAQTVEKIKQKQYEEIKRTIEEKLGIGDYNVIKEELEILQATVDTALELRRTCLDYFKEKRGKEITIFKNDGSKVTGVVVGIRDDEIILEKEFAVEDEKAYTKIKVNLRDILLRQFMELSETDLSNPYHAVVLYSEAVFQGDILLSERLRGKTGEHILLPYVDREKEVEIEHEPSEIFEGQALGPNEDIEVPWVNLVEGNSKEKSGWFCSERERNRGMDNFVVRNKRLNAPSEEISVIMKKIGLSNCEFEFSYEMNAGLWDFKIFNNEQRISFRFERMSWAQHHIRIIINRTAVDIFEDGGKVDLNGSGGMKVRFDARQGEQWVEADRMTVPLQGSGFIRCFSDESATLQISNFRYRPLEGSDKERPSVTAENNTAVSSALEDGSGWIDLIRGNSKEEAGWSCREGAVKKGCDSFRIEDGKLVVSGEYQEACVYKKVTLGDCEFEFDYETKGPGWLFAIETVSKKDSITVGFWKRAGRKHHVRIVIAGTIVSVYIDGKDVSLDRSLKARVRFYTYVDSKRFELEKIEIPLSGEGDLILSAFRSTALAISNLRYRHITK